MCRTFERHTFITIIHHQHPQTLHEEEIDEEIDEKIEMESSLCCEALQSRFVKQLISEKICYCYCC